MKRKIILHGQLKDLYDETIEVTSDTIAEAMRALQQIEILKSTGPHPVYIEGVDDEISLYGVSEMSEIHVYPMTEGSGSNPLAQILIGVTLIAVGIFAPGIAAGLLSQSQLIIAGGLLVTGGLLQLLAPAPTIEEDKESKYIGASANTTAIGTRIPITYGFQKIYGHFLNFDVDAIDFDGNQESVVVDKTVYGDSAYVEYDKTTTVDGIGVVDPRFASATAAATGNDPVAGWTP